jgi:hypothetical protein
VEFRQARIFWHNGLWQDHRDALGNGASEASVDVVAMDEPALPTSRDLIEHVISRATERSADFSQVVEAGL